jgi:hypothetical protein
MTTLHDVTELAAIHGVEVRGIVSRDDGASCVLFIISPDESSAVYFSTGFLQSEQQAVDFAYGLMQESTEELMNILKNDKLFPNIRGVMLKDKPVTLHMSGNVKITELQGGDARVELFFSDHKKTAVLNRNQALHIIDAHGPETDAWKGKPVVLFAEEGVWFGKRQWGLRVNADATKKAWSAEKNGKGKTALVTPDGDNEPSPAMMRELHAIGVQKFGGEWDDARHELIGKLTDGRTQSSKQLTYEEVVKLAEQVKSFADFVEEPLFDEVGGVEA